MTRWRTLGLAVVVALSTYTLVRGSMPDVQSGQWHAAGPLRESRAGASAALLPDGAVLVTGGSDARGALASAELFTADGIFSSAASMAAARARHTSVTLRDGGVLLLGGQSADGAVASAEIYSAGSWSPAGELTDPRWGHTATLLDDGRVLVAGGENAAGSIQSVEIYDPGTRTSSIAGTLASARQGHAAVALADGRVLFAGGFDGAEVLSSIDVFDPSTGSVSSLSATLTTPRAGHSATRLLDGRVLFFGGNDGSADLASGEIFDPVAGIILPAASAAFARREHQAFLLPNNNAVLIVGGVTPDGPSASSELYLPWSDQFRPTGAMSTPRAGATGSPLSVESYGAMSDADGRLLVAGGEGLGSAEVYGFATIKTDRDDYLPGDTVYVSGAGWQPNETVSFGLRELPAEHEARSFSILADASGRIPATMLFEVEPHHLGVSFLLTGRGVASQAHVSFTDGNLQQLTLAPPSRSVIAGSSAQYTAEVRMVGNSEECTITLSVSTGLPGGATASFDNNPITTTNVNFSRTLTITTSGSTPPGTYPFTAVAVRGSNCQGNNNETALGTLVVTAANASPLVTPSSQSVLFDEGQTATNTGTWSDSDAADTVTLSASIGTIVKNGTNAAGTWSWSMPTTDGPDESQTVTITADDGKGGVTTTTFGLTVNNVGPVVSYVLAPASADEGETKTYTFTVSDPGADTYAVSAGFPSCGSGGNLVAGSLTTTGDSGAQTGSFQCTFPDGPATPDVRIEFTDSDGLAGAAASATVQVANVAPTVAFTAGPTSVDESGAVEHTYAYSISDPGDDTVNSVATSCGSGGTKVAASDTHTDTSGSFKCVFPDGPASPTVSVTATDSDGAAGNTAERAATVTNVAPIADAGADASLNEGSTLLRVGSFTDPGADTWTATVDYGDGAGPQTLVLNADKTFSLNHVYGDNGSFTITVTVTDDDGSSGSDTVAVTVLNVAPTVNTPAVSPEPSLEGGSVTASAAFSDPGLNETPFTCTVDYGDGSGQLVGTIAGAACTGPAHVYADNQSFTVTFRVTDKDGATGFATSTHVVNNVAPVVSAVVLSPEPSVEGTAVTASATFTDPGVNDAPFSCRVNYGDGSPVVTVVALNGTCTGPAHTYADDGSFTVTITIADKDGGAGGNAGTHVVNNADPVLESLTATAFTVPVNSSVTVSGEYSDPGADDTHTCYIRWDDGTAEQTVDGNKDMDARTLGSCSGTRTFAMQGVYTIEMRVKDDDGGTSNTMTVLVTVYDPNGGFVTGGGWILSPAGALDPYSTVTGKANFGFVSKYKKGSHVPEGQTEFQFKAGGIDFHSSAYDEGSLVVASFKAQYKGTGTLNGEPGYKFILTAYDGQIPGGGGVDKFRIKIVRLLDGQVVYDNARGASDDIDAAVPTVIGGGSIVIHDGKK